MKHSVLVIGLGRFGASAARELMRLGHEVLAIDSGEAIVNDIAPEVTHAIQLDAADEDALRAVGAAEFDHAIVAISSNVEASIFATMALKKLGMKNLIAKAANPLHGAILERVGADRVVYPAREMGTRVA
ncbi:MAG: potassium channel family protein, partial [Vicinamibacteria bacterium]